MRAWWRPSANLILVAFVVLSSGAGVNAQDGTHARPDGQADHAVVIELGAAGDWSHGDPFHPGGTLAFEVTPVEHWLELESGVTVLRADKSTETSVDLLLKKPWQLSRTVEFMAGVGPELVHATGTNPATFWGVEVVGDLMVWPRRNVGWYVEPGYEMTVRQGARQHGLEVAVGVIIGR